MDASAFYRLALGRPVRSVDSPEGSRKKPYKKHETHQSMIGRKAAMISGECVCPYGNTRGYHRKGAEMDISNLLGLMRERRSYRAFKPDEVPEEAIRYILEAGRWAPSSANSQPWDFIIVTERETKEKIQENIRKVIEEIRSLRDFPFLRTFTADYMLEAPTQIVVCCDTRFMRVSMMNGVDEQIEQFAFWGSVSMAI
jgi:hypothetical protein